jgi:hypothetical protein
VPTLRELLSSSERPAVWRQSSEDYDHERMGVTAERLEVVPSVDSVAERRWYFDTALPGKGRGGHDFGDSLTAAERDAVLEYLKTL